MVPVKSPAARSLPSHRKEAEAAVLAKEAIVDLRSSVLPEKMVTLAECVAAKS